MGGSDGISNVIIKGINVVQNMPNHLKLGAVYDVIHALYSPLGILIGVLLENTGNNQIEWIFNALAAGTFLYVGTLEILAEVFESKKDKNKKFIALALGIACICVMQIEETYSEGVIYH
jgi:zinc transporter ZupT